MTAAASTRLPSPMAVTGVVSYVISERALVVRISDTASGYERLTWKEAWRALKSAEERGWRGYADPTVWADTAKADKVAHAVAGDAVSAGCCVSRLGMRRLICSWSANQV